MIQDPNPTDDPEMEQFCEWLYMAGFANQMEFHKLKEVWLRGRVAYYGERLSGNKPIPETTYEVLSYLYRESVKQLYQHLSPTPATASNPILNRPHAEHDRHPRKPASASVGKDYSHCVKHNTYPADNDPCWQCIVENIPAATPPSGGGENWTIDTVRQLLGCGDMGISRRSLLSVSDAHNQSLQAYRESVRNIELLKRIDELEALQPRDCGEDTKRLDWMMRKISGKELREMGVQSFGNCDREAIDSAMKEQT